MTRTLTRKRRRPSGEVTVSDLTARERAEEALRESEARHRVLVDTMLQGVVHQSADGTILSMNPAAEQILGKAPAEFLGSSSVGEERDTIREDGSRFPGEEHPAMVALRTGAPVRDVTMGVYNPRQGAYRWIRIDAVPLFRPGEEHPYQVYTVFADITERKRAEEALRESERRYRDLFGAMTEGFAVHEIIHDAEGRPVDFRFLDLNPAFEHLTGLGRDIIGKTHEQVLPGDDPKFVQLYGKVALTGEPVRFENYSPALKRHYEVVAFRPAPGQFATIFTDITERKRVEQALRDSERLYRAIGESIEYGVWVCAPDGRNLYASDSFLKLVGLTQEQCSSFGWGDVLHPDDAERTIAAWKECVRTEGTWDIEHRFRGVDGAWHPVLARGVPVRDEQGRIACWAGINLDISRLKQTQDALREADQRKNEFLAMLSHELRNPLAAVRTSLHVLRLVEPGSEQARRSREVIERQVGQLVRLVDDLLDVTRITRGKIQLRPEPLELDELLRRTAEDHRDEYARAGVQLEVRIAGPPIRIQADAARLGQAVGNLLQNAAKFTPRSGHVLLSLERDEPRDEAVIRVRDTGAGIAPEVLPRLFQPFTQADETLDRSKGGLGLGLSLVKGLVELHGGAVEVRSEGLGRGAEFTVRLRLRDEAAAPETPRAAPPEACQRRVLIIEDNADAAESLRDALQLDGHEVEVAHEGPGGMDRARSFRPEVVLCDIGLPGMDGYAVARALRADPALRSTFLVALTGYARPEDLARAREAGFDDHLAKPPSLERVEQLLGALDRARRDPR